MSRRHFVIPETDGLYSCDEDGNVYSNGRTQDINNMWGGVTTRRLSGKKLRPYRSASGLGYLMVDLSLPSGKKKCLVHRLVAETFLEKCAETDEVNHKDLDKLNNKVENLEWCTRTNNIRHSISQKNHGGPYGKQKLTLEERVQVANRVAEVGAIKASTEFNICYGYCRRLFKEHCA